ncbi:YheC/YheD family protein [Paenibacillus algorifonticola]|uniref:YheC/YheD family protein n=1 Tax=Paenibacillus algorifonticola TaxID=684063 RepID=UPI003D29FB3A
MTRNRKIAKGLRARSHSGKGSKSVRTKGRIIGDKWSKTIAMRKDLTLKKHIPRTKLATKDSLRSMLKQYGMVYVKPTRGSQGRGVMKMEKRKAKPKYSYQLGLKKSRFTTYAAAYRAIRKDMKGKRYLVQKGIRLLKHKSRPFDIRLMVQRAPHGGWEATGTVGRAAHPRKIVTNGSQGGTIYSTVHLLKKHAGPARRKRLLKQMDRLALRTAKLLRRTSPGIKELGLDYAIDGKLKPWILEVNTVPDPCPFSLLADQTMLRRIVRYGKAYGKTYSLKCKKAKRGK